MCAHYSLITEVPSLTSALQFVFWKENWPMDHRERKLDALVFIDISLLLATFGGHSMWEKADGMNAMSPWRP